MREAVPGTPSSLSGISPPTLSSLSSVKVRSFEISSDSSQINSLQSTSEDAFEGVTEKRKVSRIRVEFLDTDGKRIENSRYSSNEDIVEVVSSIVRGEELNYRNAAVTKLCESKLFGNEIHRFITNKISKQVESFIASSDCPLRNPNLLSNFEEISEFDFKKILDKCKLGGEGGFISSIAKVCLGVEVNSESQDQRYTSQRLLAILAISVFSRSQKVNVIQRVLGEFFKVKSVGKQALQLLHKLGLSMVSMTIRADQDVVGQHFLREIFQRKKEIEIWFERRKMLEGMKAECLLSVKFTGDQYIISIKDLGEERVEALIIPKVVKPDQFVIEMIKQNENNVQSTLEEHLNARPKMYDVCYDNIDITINSSEYVMGQRDNSLHWCSSIVIEDIVDAKEISDKKIDRNLLAIDFEKRIDLTEDELEHLLESYIQVVANLIAQHWPHVFPDLKLSRNVHQYSKEMEKEVKIYTGPLVCETESTLEGISKVITKLTGDLCPVALDECVHGVPIFPTTFSGDQKTEKSSRSAQLALLDNGSMKDKLSFIEGRHELLHFMFMLTDVGLNLYSDKENIEEATSLSRLIKLLNPKLENKKPKDQYYAFRDLYSDIFIAQIGEFLRNFLKVESLDNDATPESIKTEEDPRKRKVLLKELIRTFIRSVDVEYEKCKKSSNLVKKLPQYYPHHQFLRDSHRKQDVLESQASSGQSFEGDNTSELGHIYPGQKDSKKAIKNADDKNSYAMSLLNFLGLYHLMLDSIKEGNGLDCYLIQKHLLRKISGTGHKNYAVSIASFKSIVLSHPDPSYSHRFLWNIVAGRKGRSCKFARDQRNEHLNGFLKGSFRSLGVNLNEKNAQRINKAADIGVEMEEKVVEFFHLDRGGKSHTDKDRSGQIKKVMDIFKNEEVTVTKSGRTFNGPAVPIFDEARFRSWHLAKDKELAKMSDIRRKYFT